MTNLSSLSKALILTALAAAAAAAAAVLDVVSGTPVLSWDAALPLATVVASGGALWFLFAAARAVRIATEVCARAAHGDLEARVIYADESGDLGAMQCGINNMLDIADAFVREAAASMDYVSRGKYFRKVLVRGLPGAFRNSAQVINAATDSMDRKVREFKSFIAKTAEDLEKSVGGAIELIASATAELHTNADSLAGTAKETTAQSVTVAAAAEEVSVNVQTVSAAAEELSSSISEIGRQILQSAKVAESAADEAAQTNSTVAGLVEAATKIGEVVNLISDIASQTNLLALNATIEAARAGEAGKGFSVVASEVKSLANQTAKATEDIVTQIGAIQAATNAAVSAIQSIGKTIGQINEIATSIASAIEEQGAATQEIARNVHQAASGTQEVSSNISRITESAHQTGDAAGDVTHASSDLSQEAERLRSEVAKFLAGIKRAA